jgi:hypothetical protein
MGIALGAAAISPRGNVGVWIYDNPQSYPEAQFLDIIKA